jgi:sec-independent protein translocase protein TatB
MEFLNVGFGELVFLLLIAILVVGPRRAVQLARQVGRFISYLQREWRKVQREIVTEVQGLEREMQIPPASSSPRTRQPQRATPAVDSSPPPDVPPEERGVVVQEDETS